MQVSGITIENLRGSGVTIVQGSNNSIISVVVRNVARAAINIQGDSINEWYLNTTKARTSSTQLCAMFQHLLPVTCVTYLVCNRRYRSLCASFSSLLYWPTWWKIIMHSQFFAYFVPRNFNDWRWQAETDFIQPHCAILQHPRLRPGKLCALCLCRCSTYYSHYPTLDMVHLHASSLSGRCAEFFSLFSYLRRCRTASTALPDL